MCRAAKYTNGADFIKDKGLFLEVILNKRYYGSFWQEFFLRRNIKRNIGRQKGAFIPCMVPIHKFTL